MTVTADPLATWPRSANGTLMARAVLGGLRYGTGKGRSMPLTRCFFVERVTRIELALSAWESDRSGSLTALTWATDIPLVTVRDPATPG